MGVVAGGILIDVDPDVLLRSGLRMGSIGAQLGMLSDTLTAVLGSGIAAGWDPAGANFGFKYGHQAQLFADALADAANSFKSVGYMLEATGYNYRNADAASTIGGSAPTGAVGPAPSKTKAGDAPAGSRSAMVTPPAKWMLIQPFLNLIPGFGLFVGAAMTWPTGNPSLLRLLAEQWKNIGTGLAAFDGQVESLETPLSQQNIPEGGKIQEALRELGDKLTKITNFASTFAKTIADFATDVQDTQDAIRRLLDRISPDGLWDTVTGLLTGEGDDILREVAHDVGEILQNFQNQVKGVIGLLEELTTLIGDAATAFQKWIRPILVQAFGEGVGNALADAVTLYTDFQVGLVTGLIGTVSGVVSLADPDTWKGMAEVALSVAEDPSKLPGVLENMGKQFVAWDEWSGDHPGRAAGEAAFNIGSLFVPGGALTKTGNLAKGLRYGSKLLEEGRLPRFSDLPGVGGGDRTAPSLDDVPGVGAGSPNVPEIRPGNVPDSVINPVTPPHGVDAPTTPRSPNGPSGPLDPPAPTGTPGGGHGDGARPDGAAPPHPASGRSVDSPDAAPGRVDSPHDGSSTSNPANSQHVSESPAPASNESAAPAPSHAPESPIRTGTHESGSGDVDHTPTAPEAPADTRVGEQHGSPQNAPEQTHHTVSPDIGERPDLHQPADHQPAHTAATDHPRGDEPTVGESPSPEPSHAAGDGRRHDGSPQTTPAAGMPVAPHVAGGAHSAPDGHGANRNPTPETSTRAPEIKAPSSASLEVSRTTTSGASGPTAGNTPTAPVNAASTQHVSGTTAEPTRLAPEQPAPRPGEQGTPPNDGLSRHAGAGRCWSSWQSSGLGRYPYRGQIRRSRRPSRQSGGCSGLRATRAQTC